MATTDGLTSLAILPEVHIKMILEALLACGVVIETDATLLTLCGLPVIQEFSDGGTMPVTNINVRFKIALRG